MSRRFVLDKSVRLLVCDMIGTTVNDHGIIYRTLFDTIRGYDMYVNEEDMRKWHGIKKSQVIAHYISKDVEYKDNDAIMPQVIHSFKKKLMENYLDEKNKVSLMNSELPNLLNGFREKGIKVALNTGLDVDIQHKVIDMFGMNEFIDGCVSSEEVAHGRPYPFMIYNLMEKFHIKDPKNVVKIGDSYNDILEGKNAGCYKTIGVLSGPNKQDILYNHGADIVLNSIMDLS